MVCDDLLAAAAADLSNAHWLDGDSCVTSVLSLDTIRCSCSGVTGYIAVLGPPLLLVSTMTAKLPTGL